MLLATYGVTNPETSADDLGKPLTSEGWLDGLRDPVLIANRHQ